MPNQIGPVPIRKYSRGCLIATLALVGGLAVVGTVQAQTVLAHWSFDSAALSYDTSGNIIGAADSTGNHNAFVDGTTGVGTANSGGPVPSGIFPGTDAVPGAPFGGTALEFNGDNYMEYPELTELMTAAGAPGYTISLWLKIPSTVTPGNAYETMSDWGNAASTSTSSKYAYAFGPNGTTSMHGQARSGTGNGTDIYQGNATTPTINDGVWHMFTWTWNVATGSGESCFDGNPVGGITAESFPYTMANAASSYGTFGFKGDSGNFLPAGTELANVWVFNGVLDQNQITGLFESNNINAATEPSPQSAWVHYNANHVLVYSNDDLGNHIPDFSYAGYREGGVALPTNAPVQETLSPISGDNTANIQNAIDAVSALAPDADGFRGAVLLEPGTYQMDGSLTLSQSGVVLQGSGSSTTGTILHFVGNARQTVTMQGSGSVSAVGGSYSITDTYVPLGATSFHVGSGAITWGASATISGDSDVFTDGTLLYAYDWAGNNTTVNGMAFTGTTSANPGNVSLNGLGHSYTNYSSTSPPFSNLSAAYQSILVGGDYYPGPDTATVTLNNLTVGHRYAVQVWVSDPRGGGTAGRTESVISSNSVTLAYNVPPTTGGVGQYAIGVFTAMSASQSFSLTVTNSTGSTQLNALLVSDVTATGYQPVNPPPATAPFAVGESIVVQRPVTESWIDAIGMSNYWTPNSGLKFERTITAINSNRITIGIPLFNPIDQEWCTGEVYRVADAGRITNSAIEDLRLRSDFSDASTNWGSSRALNFDNCQNCWIQNVAVNNFYNGINSGGGAKWCTVQDCSFVSNTVPTTSAGGAAFGGSGQMILWQRCGSSNSTIYHVFVTQAAVPGPNVFLNFNSTGSSYDAGAHQRWAAAVLFDNDTVASPNGSNTGIKLEDRAGAGSGQGYAAGYSIIYNGNSLGIINEIPQVPYTYNWAIGGAPDSTFIHRSDDGIFDATNGYVNPRSLYLEQLRERLGGAAVENIGYKLFTISATPASRTLMAGSNVTFAVNLGDPTLMSNIVALSVSGLPPGASAVYGPSSVTGTGSATLTVTASNAIPPGNYTLTIGGSNAGLTHTTPVNLTVQNPYRTPVMNQLTVAANQLIVAGTNGTTDGNYYVLSSTNLALPLDHWQLLATNSFDGTGNFIFTNSLNPDAPQTFFRVQLQ